MLFDWNISNLVSVDINDSSGKKSTWSIGDFRKKVSEGENASDLRK